MDEKVEDFEKRAARLRFADDSTASSITSPTVKCETASELDSSETIDHTEIVLNFPATQDVNFENKPTETSLSSPSEPPSSSTIYISPSFNLPKIPQSSLKKPPNNSLKNSTNSLNDDPNKPLIGKHSKQSLSLVKMLRRASFGVGLNRRYNEEGEQEVIDMEWDNNGRRPSLRSETTYGTMYTPLFQKLNLLHRMSFPDAVEKITLTWENINVYVPGAGKKSLFARGSKDLSNKMDAKVPSSDAMNSNQKQILKNVSGMLEPGTLLAVMGASGSGKTSLLNVLTYRNRGNLVVDGDIRVNGGKIGRAMPSLSAYVQQDDLFLPMITVKEHLYFQSQLRMDKDIPKELRQERVQEVMQEMGLLKCADVKIGEPGKIKGISGGEKKRLAFASELLTNPSLMFLDEPTSGLDSYMASNILLTLKQLTKRGRSIICTIHQPSSQLFELFDKLMLISEGRVAYIGPADQASVFFTSCGHPLPQNYNPADHFIKALAIEPGKEQETREKSDSICDLYEGTQEAAYVNNIIQENNVNQNGAMYEEESFPNLSPYKAHWGRQFVMLMWRCGLHNLREPAVFKIRLMQIIVLSIIYSLAYWQQKMNQAGVSNLNGAMFLMQLQMTLGFIFNVVMIFPSEFPVYLREHFNGVYRADVYFLCKTLVEIPQFTILPFIFTALMYWTIGFYSSASAFFICFGCNFMVCNVSVSFGYLLSTAFNNTAKAIAFGPLFITPCLMIGGFFVNAATIPIYLAWLKYVSWFTYANEILVVNQWYNVEHLDCEYQNMTAKCFSSGKEVIASLSYQDANLTFDFVMLLVLMVVFRLIAFLLLLIRSIKNYKLTSKKNV